MKLLKYLAFFLTVGLYSTSLFAQRQETSFDRELNSRDDQPVREFVESKENIDLKEKSKNLEISGDVRFEWRSIQEKGVVLYENNDYYEDEIKIPHLNQVPTRFRYLRGGNHVDKNGLPLSTNDFDVEFNLKIRYTFKDAWMKAHLQFDNPAGIRGRNPCEGIQPVFNKNGSLILAKPKRNQKWAIKGSGEGGAVSLKRAYMGYNIYADGKHRLDIEIGRQKLDDIFDSEIEFTSRFDGVLLRYASAVEEVFDWYLTGGVFVVDELVNHFGCVGEVGFLDIYESGIDLRYNIIDWKKNGKNQCHKHNPYGANFLNSQVTLTYTFAREFCNVTIPFEFYSGFLINHAAKKTIFTKWKKKNLGWYVGTFIGNVDKKGDWSVDIEYISVQAQAVPEQDVGSIGRGNILDENLMDFVNDPNKSLTSSDISSRGSSRSYFDEGVMGYFPRRGNTNFNGWRFELLYAITDNFTLDFVYEFSSAEDKGIGGRHEYRDFEIEAIFAF